MTTMLKEEGEKETNEVLTTPSPFAAPVVPLRPLVFWPSRSTVAANGLRRASLRQGLRDCDSH